MPAIDNLVPIILIAVVGLILFRTISGRLKFPPLHARIAAEGIIRSERRVWTRFNFPMIKKIIMGDIYLTNNRLVVFHWFTRKQVLQVPVGPQGCAGTDKGRFETERRGKKEVLLVRAVIRGGGRIRFHLADAAGWLEDIVRN